MTTPIYLVVIEYKHHIGEVSYALYNVIEYLSLDLLKAKQYAGGVQIGEKRYDRYMINSICVMKSYLETPYENHNLMDSEIIYKK